MFVRISESINFILYFANCIAEDVKPEEEVVEPEKTSEEATEDVKDKEETK